MWKSFLEVVRFILTKYDLISSHGDPIRAIFFFFDASWMQVLSLDASLVPGCKSCPWMQVLSLDASLVPKLALSCPSPASVP